MPTFHRARRAIALFAIASGLALLAGFGTTEAGEIAPPQEISSFEIASAAPFALLPAAPDHQPPEPFALKPSTLVTGGVQNKWGAVKRKLPREHKVLMRCRAHAATCPPAAKRFLAVLDRAMTREGTWARIAEINRTINLDIRPLDDMTQYGVVDLWATPLMAFASNAGDCEDYAIAKYVALQEIGIATADLRLVVVHDEATKQDHAVAAVRYDGRWIILDNRTLGMRQDVDVTEFSPLFVVDSDGVKRATAAGKSAIRNEKVNPAAMGSQFSAGGPTAPLLL